MTRRRALVFAGRGLLAVAVLVAAPLVGLLLSRGGETPDTPAPKPTARATPSATVPTDFVAVILPQQMANLSPRADGRILAVPAKLGQRVRAGQPLVTLDPRERQHDLSMAQAELAMSRAEAAGAASDFAAARKRAARRTATVDVGGQRVPLVSGEEAAQAGFEAQSAAARSATATARIAEQKAKVERLKVALEETELVAPFDGVVTAVNFEAGMTAHTGDIVVRVVGGEGLRARIAVPEEAAQVVRRPRAVLAVDGKTLQARIDQVALEVEPASRTFLVEGSLDLDTRACGGDCSLLSGRAARARLVDVRE
jgi:RND family efflux transporter MFP subunit